MKKSTQPDLRRWKEYRIDVMNEAKTEVSGKKNLLSEKIKPKRIRLKNSSGEITVRIERPNGDGFTIEDYIKRSLKMADLQALKDEGREAEQRLLKDLQNVIGRLYIVIE